MEAPYEFTKDRDTPTNKTWEPHELKRFIPMPNKPVSSTLHFECDEKTDHQEKKEKVKSKKPTQQPKKEIPMDNIVIHKTGNLANDLRDIVTECIEKVREDKSYIPQANAINTQIQTLINLKKLEIENQKLKRLLAMSFDIPPEPTLEAIENYFIQSGCPDRKLAAKFFNHYEGSGWMRGNTRITNWKPVADQWMLKEVETKSDKQSKLVL